MYSTRQNKVSRLLQKELATIFQQESKNHFNGKMISVTTVRVTKDLVIARVYISVFPSEGTEEILQLIKSLAGMIRGILGQKVGKQIRIVPNLEFYVDDSLDYIDNIETLLKDK